MTRTAIPAGHCVGGPFNGKRSTAEYAVARVTQLNPETGEPQTGRYDWNKAMRQWDWAGWEDVE